MNKFSPYQYFTDNLAATVLTEKVLLGRGYFPVFNGMVKDYSMPAIDDINQDYIHDSEVSSIIKEKVAGSFLKDKTANKILWVKFLPFLDILPNNQEAHNMIILECYEKDGHIRIKQGKAYCWIVEGPEPDGTTWVDWEELGKVPTVIEKEVHMLYHKRYIPNGFSLRGKIMPSEFKSENKEAFARPSSFRNGYWHVSISKIVGMITRTNRYGENYTEEGLVIDNIEISDYASESSIFQRPKLLPDDYMDSFDAILYICDQYNDEEWHRNILGEAYIKSHTVYMLWEDADEEEFGTFITLDTNMRNEMLRKADEAYAHNYDVQLDSLQCADAIKKLILAEHSVDKSINNPTINIHLCDMRPKDIFDCFGVNAPNVM